jgi:ATP-dependent DNA ligase
MKHNSGEGLILKHPNSVYVLNGRLDHWIKIKPEYMVTKLFIARYAELMKLQDGETDTFDLLVVGT